MQPFPSTSQSALVTRAATVPVAGTMLIAVIGPPGAGKSTVVAALACEDGALVFRLRETIRARPELLAGLAPSLDPLGWVSPEAVRRVLHSTFVEDRFGLDSSAVLLDNFPGTADQLELLSETAAATAAQIALLELCADTHTVMARVAQRRVCVACGPDTHAPAVPASDNPDRCGSCRTVLKRRDTDAPRLHALRLARYAANQPEIAKRATERGIPHLAVNAGTTVSEVCRAAHRALHRLSTG